MTSKGTDCSCLCDYGWCSVNFHEFTILHGSTWVMVVGSAQLQQSLKHKECRMCAALCGAWQVRRLASAGACGTTQRCNSDRLGVEMAFGEGCCAQGAA